MASEKLPNQYGLAYNESGLDIIPIWTREPSITAIENVCRLRLQIESNESLSVSFHAEGAFNKLYLVKAPSQDRSWLMRVSLPVCPHHKTRSEVATMKWIHKNTDIPVPQVFDFDDSNANDIGFEWILMELMPGVTAYSRWRWLPMAQKVALTERIAECQAQLFRRKFPDACFRGIGSLHPVVGRSQSPPEPGQMVASEFFMGNRIKYDVPRGPFRSSHDWLKSCLEIISRDCEKISATTDDEDEKEEADTMLEVARRLLGLLPRIFPSIQNPAERTALYHHDLGLSNILIDQQGNLTAIIDWECVSTIPLWMTTRVPKFLWGPTREEEPKRDTYSNEPPLEIHTSEGKAPPDPDELDNEGKNQLYWIHLMEYDQTQLRKIYHDKMRSLWPDWDLEIAESKLKFEFYDAVTIFPIGFYLTAITKWVDKLEAGELAELNIV